MTKNLSAISEIKESIDALFELNRVLTILAKYGITNALTTQVQYLVSQGNAKLIQLEQQ